jgi:hypothetical protein
LGTRLGWAGGAQNEEKRNHAYPKTLLGKIWAQICCH